MKRHIKIEIVSLSLAAVMFTQSMPINILSALAEEIVDVLTTEETIEREFYSGNMVDKYNIGSGDIIQENVKNRTATTKEFLMSDDTIMVQQFVEPVHYLENGEYKEIAIEQEKEDTPVLEEDVSLDKTVELINVSEANEVVAETDEAYIGKKGGANKSDVFLEFQIPTVAPYYQLIGARVQFEYETKGMTLFEGKDLTFDVYVAESTHGLESITYSDKPQKIEELNGIEKNSQHLSKTMTYTSDIINPNNLNSNTLTIGLETKAETTEDAYIELNTASRSTNIQYWYQRVIGLEDEYSVESFSVNGATSYINNGTGQLTSVVDLASVNTMSDMPFSASLIYNDYYDELLAEIETNTGKVIPSIAGPCFKLNFQQFMIKHDNVYEMIDADGSISTFYPCQTRGIYYSKDKKLYYDSLIQLAYDAQGNKMYFNSTGALTKILCENNPAEYINVVYTTTYGEVDKVEYYAESVKKYTIDFTYENGKLTTVTTDADTNMPYTVGLYYNEEGNLSSIKNQTANSTGVQTLSFGYCTRYGDLDPLGMLNDIFDNQKHGVIFNRDHDDTIYKVRNMNAIDTMSEWRCCSSVEFLYKGVYTDIYYKENNVMTNSRCVSFNNSKEVISEWAQDSKGIISVQASTNWKNISTSGSADYIKETCTYYHKSLPLNSDGINENGGKLTIPISAQSLEVENHQNYSFAIIFKVFTGDNEDALLANLNLSVKIGNDTAQNIILDYGGATYIVVPCDYYSSVTDVVITNHGSEHVAVPYFAYTLVNRVQETYRYDSGIMAHRLSSTTTSLRSGYYSDVTYDEKQRVATELTREISTDSVTETTTYSYYDDPTDSNIEKGKIKEVNTTKANSENVDKTEYAYTDSWNNYTETVTTTQGDLKMRTVYNINRNTKTVTQTDENNITTTAKYATTQGDIRLSEVTYGNTTEKYAYNNFGQITSVDVYAGTCNTAIYSQTDHYDANGVYIGSSYGGTKYAYGYDNTGFVTSISQKIGDSDEQELLDYTYNSNGDGASSNKLSKKTYFNEDSEEYVYSTTATQLTHKNEEGSFMGKYTYNYNGNGAMTSQQYQTSNNRYITYNYGDLSDLEEQTLTISGLEFYFQYTNSYDTLNNRIKRSQIYSIIGCTTADYKILAYSYNSEGQISGFEYGSYDVEYAYDKMGRLTNRLVSMPYGYQNVQNETYLYKTYTQNGATYTTNQLSCIDDQTNENNDRTTTYNTNGYVTSVTYNGNTYTYTYDGVGRLASEEVNGVTTNYAYDNDSANNITQAGNKSFEYDNQGRLVQVGSDAFSYDAMGNPTTYKGNTFVWEQGRKLVSGSMNGKSFTYDYDGNGMRYEKKVNGEKTCYYYNGTQLLMESKNTQRTWYIYGVTGIEGMIVEVGYNDTIYYFDKNTLGDIIAIRDSSGNIVATYEYDAWGNCTVMDGYGYANTSSSFIGNVNPIRYRGYYYDTETGFYYLQTRYYDPTICRFINADNYELVATLSSVPGQLNMYAYCNNNPIMYTDETGESFLLTAIIVGAIIGAAIGGTVAGISAAQNGEDALGVTLAVFEGIFVGGVIGGAAGALVGVAPTIGASLGAMMSGTAGAGVMAMSAEAYLVAAGATAVLGNVMFSKTSKGSGKERSTDKPSWVNQGMLDPSKTAKQNAMDLLNNKYGLNNWAKGPNTEFNKIVKWLVRALGYK